MSSFAIDLLVLWVVATAAGALLLVLVVGVQGAVSRSRHRRAVRRRTHGPRAHAATR